MQVHMSLTAHGTMDLKDKDNCEDEAPEVGMQVHMSLTANSMMYLKVIGIVRMKLLT